MRALLLLAAFILVGCVHGDNVFGYPPTGGAEPSPVQPSNTDSAEEKPSLLRARFRTSASVAEVNRSACSLQASIVVDGRSRPVDVHVGGVTPCGPTTEGAVRANLKVDSHDGTHEVVMEFPVAEGASEQEIADLKQGLRDVERELARRVASIKQAAVGVPEPIHRELPRERRRASANVLLVSLILWGCAAATAGVGGLMVASGMASRNGSGDIGLVIIGLGTMLFGAAPLGAAGLVTLIVAGGLYAADH